MFAESAGGEFPQLIVVYKAENIKENWLKNSPVRSIYDATKSDGLL